MYWSKSVESLAKKNGELNTNNSNIISININQDHKQT
jgi:hypothetical protein